MVRENEERNDPARLCADTDMHRIVREVEVEHLGSAIADFIHARFAV